MTQITLRHGTFLPPFHPMEELSHSRCAKPSLRSWSAHPDPFPHLYEHFGLVRLTQLGRGPSWVKA